jgi:hypothetical protein
MANEAEVEPLQGIAAVDHVLNICGFVTPNTRASVRNEGFALVSDFGMMKASNFSAMSARITKMKPAEGGFRFGEVHIRNLEALAFWVRDKQRRNELIVAEEFTVEERDRCRSLVDTERIEIDQAEASKAASPVKFEVANWVAWEIVFTNYLSGIYGVSGVPLHYVIRKPLQPGHVCITDSEKLVALAPLTGQFYTSDTQRVY